MSTKRAPTKIVVRPVRRGHGYRFRVTGYRTAGMLDLDKHVEMHRDSAIEIAINAARHLWAMDHACTVAIYPG